MADKENDNSSLSQLGAADDAEIIGEVEGNKNYNKSQARQDALNKLRRN